MVFPTQSDQSLTNEFLHTRNIAHRYTHHVQAPQDRGPLELHLKDHGHHQAGQLTAHLRLSLLSRAVLISVVLAHTQVHKQKADIRKITDDIHEVQVMETRAHEYSVARPPQPVPPPDTGGHQLGGAEAHENRSCGRRAHFQGPRATCTLASNHQHVTSPTYWRLSMRAVAHTPIPSEQRPS